MSRIDPAVYSPAENIAFMDMKPESSGFYSYLLAEVAFFFLRIRSRIFEG
jgi:hypothetical protein